MADHDTVLLGTLVETAEAVVEHWSDGSFNLGFRVQAVKDALAAAREELRLVENALTAAEDAAPYVSHSRYCLNTSPLGVCRCHYAPFLAALRAFGEPADKEEQG